MAEGRFISYLRVSTAKQGATGLGVEAQRRAVTEFLNGGRWTLITEVVEVESGKRNDRPRLDEALKLCRLHNATLVIAKLDRLSRDAAFLLNLQSAGVRFIGKRSVRGRLVRRRGRPAGRASSSRAADRPAAWPGDRRCV